MCYIIDYFNNNPKDFINIVFWVFTSFLAYITYCNAKKTLFNPVRSEMVKYQLKVITEFIDKHTSKGLDFESSINYRLLLKLNYDVDYLLYLYSEEHIYENHDFTDDDDAILKFCKENVAGLFEAHQGEDKKIYFDTMTTGDFDVIKQYVNIKLVKSKEKENNSLKLQRIFFTKQFNEFYNDLVNLESNPFVPEEIKKNVIIVIENIKKNFKILYDILAKYIGEQNSGKYQDALNEFYGKKITHDEDLKKLRNQITVFFKVNKM